MFGKAVFCQEQITVGALKRTQAEGSHAVTICVVAARVGKEGSRKPSLLGRNHHIKLATKQQNVRN
ncbi:hypothetical protein B6D18_04375 [Gilliamella sp. A7]|nr:hypothetical protein B6D18_04375 [Gilliamella sp. A7]